MPVLCQALPLFANEIPWRLRLCPSKRPNRLRLEVQPQPAQIIPLRVHFADNADDRFASAINFRTTFVWSAQPFAFVAINRIELTVRQNAHVEGAQTFARAAGFNRQTSNR